MIHPVPVLLLSWFVLASLPAQQQRFEHLDRRDGLPNASISSLARDSRGFLWLGTQGGLSRYDGYTFRNFKNAPFDENSLSHDLVQTLFMDKDDVLWVGTYRGLNRLDLRSEKIVRYQADPEDPASLSNDVVVSIMRDSRGRLWVGTLHGLNVLDEAGGRFIRHFKGDERAGGLRNDVIRSLFEDSQGAIWIGTYGGAHRYDEASGTFVNYRFGADAVMVIREDSRGNLWFGTWGGAGLYRLDRATGTFVPYEVPDTRVYSLNVEDPDALLVGTWGGGLIDFSPSRGVRAVYRRTENEHDGPRNDIIYSLLRDGPNLVWVGTNGGGLSKKKLILNDFETFSNNPKRADSLSAGKITAIRRDSRERLWIGVYNGGLNRLLPGGGFRRYSHDPSDAHSLPNDIVTSIFEDARGEIRITTNAGLVRYREASDDFERFEGLSDTVIYCLAETPDGSLWVGTYNAGLDRVTPHGIRSYSLTRGSGERLSDNLVFALTVDRSGGLWVGTNNGLNRYRPESDDFRVFRHDPRDRSSLSSDTVRVVFEDSSRRLWIGTVSGGLNLLNETGDGFTHFTMQDGLPDNSILGILEGDDGKLWISTRAGLCIFDPLTRTFRLLDEDDGMPGNEMTAGHFRSSDGGLYFGGTFGVVIIRTADFRPNQNEPRVFLTSFRVFDREYPLPVSPPYVESIDLNYRQNYIAFEFAAIDFYNPGRNSYAYMLEGFDREWIMAGARRYVGYTNLPGGSYVFRVKAANSSGVWSARPLSVRLTVRPPFWATPPAYALYLLSVVAVAAGVTMAATRAQRRRLWLREKQIERERLDYLERAIVDLEKAALAKSEFIAGVSHEFRTPLNAIIGYASMLKDLSTDAARLGSVIERNGRALLALVSEVLDLSRLESGGAELHPRELRLNELCDDLESVFVPLARRKNLEFTLNLDPGLPAAVTVDDLRLRQVLLNVIGNAVKFTSTGFVRVDLAVRSGVNARTDLVIAVADSGPGIPSDQHEAIFEPFVQLREQDPASGGAGLGLAITKRVVRSMGGSIDLESEPGRGSVFTIALPVVSALAALVPAGRSAVVGCAQEEPVEAAQSAPAAFLWGVHDAARIERFKHRACAEFLPAWAALKDAPVIDDWREFARVLSDAARAEDLPNLLRYAEELAAAIDDFDLPRVKRLFARFAELCAADG